MYNRTHKLTAGVIVISTFIVLLSGIDHFIIVVSEIRHRKKWYGSLFYRYKRERRRPWEGSGPAVDSLPMGVGVKGDIVCMRMRGGPSPRVL